MVIAVLGRKDYPTDAIEDYSSLLGQALRTRGLEFTLFRVRWEVEGRLRALVALWRVGAAWRGEWVLLQYTSLMWSRRGFPFLLPMVLALLQLRRARVALVFHDQGPFGGTRLVDRIRRQCQLVVMRWAYQRSKVAILAASPEQVWWLPSPVAKAVWIPIGANVPVCPQSVCAPNSTGGASTLTVFAITDAGDISRELADIACVAKFAAQRFGSVRLITLGRGSRESEVRLRLELEGSPVEFHALGILPAEEVSRVLAASDVSLYVRSPISTQRGSAIASIAAGVPLVAYAEGTLPAPLAEAGVIDVPFRDRVTLAEAAVRVLADPELQRELRQRSRRTYPKNFAWEAVAGRFLEVLRLA